MSSVLKLSGLKKTPTSDKQRRAHPPAQDERIHELENGERRYQKDIRASKERHRHAPEEFQEDRDMYEAQLHHLYELLYGAIDGEDCPKEIKRGSTSLPELLKELIRQRDMARAHSRPQVERKPLSRSASDAQVQPMKDKPQALKGRLTRSLSPLHEGEMHSGTLGEPPSQRDKIVKAVSSQQSVPNLLPTGLGQMKADFQKRDDFWRARMDEVLSHCANQWQHKVNQQQHTHSLALTTMQSEKSKLEKNLTELEQRRSEDLNKIQNEHEHELHQMMQHFSDEIQGLKDRNREQLSVHDADLKRRVHDLECHIQNLQQRLRGEEEQRLSETKEHKNQLDSLSRAHAEELDVLEAQFESEIRSAVHACAQEMKKLDQDHKSTIEKLTNNHYEELDSVVFELKAEISTIKELESCSTAGLDGAKETLEREVAELQSQHKAQLLELRAKLTDSTAEVERMTAQHDSILLQSRKEAEMEMKAMVDRNEKTLARLDNAYRAKIRTIEETIKMDNQTFREISKRADGEKEQHQNVISRLSREIQVRDDAIFRRDRFTGMSDDILEGGFEDLVISVNEICHQNEWLSNGPVLAVQATLQTAENSSRLCSLVLRDRIWWLLYDNIFCSPFRIFGDSGRQLEKDWQAVFGQGKLLFIACICKRLARPARGGFTHVSKTN
jgi:hypothetical protein